LLDNLRDQSITWFYQGEQKMFDVKLSMAHLAHYLLSAA
jgi:hypothetical protein